jgi:hypothetical protein
MKKSIFSLALVTTLLAGCSNQTGPSNQAKVDSIVKMMNLNADYEYVGSNSELAENSQAVVVGTVKSVFKTREIVSKSSGISFVTYGLQIQVDSVAKGNIELGSLQTVEISPVSESLLDKLDASLRNSEGVFYLGKLISYGDSFNYKNYPSISNFNSTWSIAGPEGLAMNFPEDRLVVWPLIGSSANGSISETLPDGSLVPPRD